MFQSFSALLLSLAISLTLNAQSQTWKAVMISGDDSIKNFDNSRESILSLLAQSAPVVATELTSSRALAAQNPSLIPALLGNISKVFERLDVKNNEGCFIHMSSHGIQGQGFYLSLGGVLTPAQLAQMVNKACGNKPTVVLVSACFSGQFITQEIKGPNRIIMTAAIHNRPSFGCSPDTTYTYWDGCMIEEWNRSNTWYDLSSRVRQCIARKETQAGVPSSFPQSYFGEKTKNWTLGR
jgi:hypothetical protein